MLSASKAIRCLWKPIFSRSHSSMPSTCTVYHRRHTFLKKSPNLKNQKALFSSTAIKFNGSNDDNDKSKNSFSKQLEDDEELRSYINEIRKEFGVSETEELVYPDELENEDDLKPEVQTDDIKESKDGNPSPLSLQEKFVSYDDEVTEVILDESEVYEILERGEDSLHLLEKRADYYAKMNLERGETGVFDLPEFIDALRSENLKDICVVQVPKNLHYTDHIVIANCKSAKHSAAVAAFIRKLHKRKKHSNDPYLRIEGNDCPDWKAIDLGNIVLHLFLPETREKFDLETLWTVGKAFDDLSHQAEDPMVEAILKHSVLLGDYEPLSPTVDK